MDAVGREDRSYADRVVERPVWGRLRQGTIFCGASAEGYAGCEVAGVVITAHCDLRHEKTGVVNFLPAVRFSDWLCRDYARLLADYLRKELREKLERALNQIELSDTLLLTLPLDAVLDRYINPLLANKKPPRAALTFQQAAQQLLVVQRIESQPALGGDDLRELCSVNEKAARQLASEGLRQRLNGYYFLPTLGPDYSSEGYVVLLRSIYHLPAAIAREIASGLDWHRYQYWIALRSASQFQLAFIDSEAFSMPVGQIRSPYLEHLMQAFGGLYTRIGVEDIPEIHIDRLASRIAEIHE